MSDKEQLDDAIAYHMLFLKSRLGRIVSWVRNVLEAEFEQEADGGK